MTMGEGDASIRTTRICIGLFCLSGTGEETVFAPQAATIIVVTGLTGSSGTCLQGMIINMCIAILDTI